MKFGFGRPATGTQTTPQAGDQTDLQSLSAAIDRSLAVIEFTPDGIILTANANFLAIVGYRLDEIVGKHHSMFVEPAHRDSPEYRQFWDKLARGDFDRAQYRRLGKGGKEAWLEATYNPIFDASGRTTKVIKFATDITERKRREIQHEFDAGIKNSLDAVTAKIMATDNAHNIIFVNRAAMQLMLDVQTEIRKSLPNFDAQRLVGTNIDAFHQRPAHQRSMLEGLKGTMNAKIKLGDRTLALTGSPMLDRNGVRLGTVMEWVDQTDTLGTEAELETVVAAVLKGNLTARIDAAGKAGFFAAISHKINELIDNFAAVVTQVKSAAAEVARGVQEISHGNEDLSTRTESQASSLEQTASSMEQMTASVRQNADNSGQANQLAVAARDQADKGGAVVAKAVRAMGEINQSSKKIADIIGVIDEIAFQTNLLALNAAVEAARAGEQGRGFAVVASEVRNLAGRSATAAKEIKGLIRDSVQKVEEGSTLVAQSGQTLEQIVGAVKRVSDIIAEIAASSHEQSSGIEQVNKAVMQLDEMTQQNAALVEQATAASRSIADQSQALNAIMDKYEVGVRSGAAAAAPSPAVHRPAAGKPKPRASVRIPAAAPPAPVAERPKKAVGAESDWQEF